MNYVFIKLLIKHALKICVYALRIYVNAFLVLASPYLHNEHYDIHQQEISDFFKPKFIYVYDSMISSPLSNVRKSE